MQKVLVPKFSQGPKMGFENDFEQCFHGLAFDILLLSIFVCLHLTISPVVIK